MAGAVAIKGTMTTSSQFPLLISLDIGFISVQGKTTWRSYIQPQMKEVAIGPCGIPSYHSFTSCAPCLQIDMRKASGEQAKLPTMTTKYDNL